MNLRIFVKIVICCACLYACKDGLQVPPSAPIDFDFNFDSSFYPKRIGAQWKYARYEAAQSGLSSNPWERTWSYNIQTTWVWTLIHYRQINADSASLLISAVDTTEHTRTDARYDSGPNGQPIVISTLTTNTAIGRDTGIIGISRQLITLEFKNNLVKPTGAYWDGRSLTGSKYSDGPFAKRKGYISIWSVLWQVCKWKFYANRVYSIKLKTGVDALSTIFPRTIKTYQNIDTCLLSLLTSP